jgi:hypothetical protein
MATQTENFKTGARRIGRRLMWIIVAALLVIGAAYYFWRTYTYSDGSRAGMLYKISKKGYVFKTYEGQLHQGGSIVINDQSIFNFSVKNREVYDELQKLEGKNVRVFYHELNDAFPWQGDTDYMVYKAELVDQPLPDIR